MMLAHLVRLENECNLFRKIRSFLVLGGSSSCIIGSLLGSGLGKSSLVKIERSVLLSDGLDETLGSKVLDECSGDGTANLELLGEDGSSDAEDLGDFLEHSLVALLLEEDGVVHLLLNLDLGPGLLLRLGLASGFLRRLSVFGCACTRILCTLLLLLSLHKTSQNNHSKYLPLKKLNNQ